MPPRKLYARQSLADVIWYHLVYLEARLLNDPNAADLAPEVTALVERVEAVWREQRAVWRSQINAQARVSYLNRVLDKHTIQHSKVLLSTDDINFDTNHPRYKRYYPEPLSRIVRKALAAQVKLIRTWIESIRGEPEPQVQAYADIFLQDIVDADQALAELEQAKAARKDHRVRQIHELVKDINKTLRKIYGILESRAGDLNQDDEWAGSFFYRPQNAGEEDNPADDLREAIYAVFNARRFEVSEDVEKKLEETSDVAILDGWLKRVVSAKSPEEAILGASPVEKKAKGE